MSRCYYHGTRKLPGCADCHRPPAATTHVACGDIDRDECVVVCTCGLLKQSGRPHGYERDVAPVTLPSQKATPVYVYEPDDEDPPGSNPDSCPLTPPMAYDVD